MRITKVKYNLEPARADQLSVNAGLALGQGIIRLAQSAACEERLDDGSNTEVMLWYVVRSLCVEAGFDYDEMVKAGREFAGQL